MKKFPENFLWALQCRHRKQKARVKFRKISHHLGLLVSNRTGEVSPATRTSDHI